MALMGLTIICLRGVMADPITAGLLVLGSVATMASEVGAAQFNEKVAKQNKQIAAQQTVAAEEDKRRENIKRLGAARAAAGASGFASSGSVLDIFSENAANAERDILNIRYQGDLQQRTFTNEAKIEGNKKNTAIVKGIIGTGKALAGPSGFGG